MNGVAEWLMLGGTLVGLLLAFVGYYLERGGSVRRTVRRLGGSPVERAPDHAQQAIVKAALGDRTVTLGRVSDLESRAMREALSEVIRVRASEEPTAEEEGAVEAGAGVPGGLATRPAPPATSAEVRGRAVGGPPWLAFAFVFATITALVVFYALAAGSAGFAFIELMVGFASVAVASMLGFLFGIPRTPNVAAPGGTKNQPAPNGSASEKKRGQLVYEPSTSLEQVSDWLTKILVGAGLVQLGKLRDGLVDIGEMAAAALADKRGTMAFTRAAIATQAVVVVGGVIGFLGAFLWTRIYYAGIQTRADADVWSRLSDVEERLEGTSQFTGDLAQRTLPRTTPGDAAALAPASTDAAPPEAGLPEPVLAIIAKVRSLPPIWDSDPIPGVLGSARNPKGRVIEVEIVTELPGTGLALRCRVRSGGAEPLVKPVVFLLHPTYDERVYVRQPKDDVAELQTFADGWYTIGVVADDGATTLLYSLKELPNAPDWFKRS